MKVSRWAVIFSGFAALLTVLFLRSTGIHIDENNYINYTRAQPLGDTQISGKPYFFYVVNYLLAHSAGIVFGPLTLHYFYLLLIVLAIAYLAKQLARRENEFVWYFFGFLLLPFVVFNSTQLMMETPIVALLAFSFGALIDLERRGQNLRSNLVLFFAASLAILVKETSIAAIIILGIGFGFSKKWQIGVFLASLVFGVVLTKIMLLQVGSPPHQYGGVSNLVSIDHIFDRISSSLSYFEMWIFYVGLPSILAVIALVLKPSFRAAPENKRLLILTGLSLLATFAIQIASNEDFVRYAYPAVCIGVFSTAALAFQSSKTIRVLLLVTYVIPTLNLWLSPMSYWPEVITRESYYSGYTVLPGVPLYRWIALSGEHRKHNCIFLPKQSSEKIFAIRNILSNVTENSKFFDETQISDFEKCDGPKIIARRQYQKEPSDCLPTCSDRFFSFHSCTPQPMKGWATFEGQILTNVTCLP